MLEEIRVGKCSRRTIELLERQKSKVFADKHILPTKLCTHKDDVDFINNRELEALDSASKRTYVAVDSHPHASFVFNAGCPAKQTLTLKLNAQVMLIKNLDVANNLVNGSRGVVVRFTPTAPHLPVVRFLNNVELVVKYDTWSCGGGGSGNSLTRKQLPLQLAWAISIHKSQGMTLDCVELSLSRVFECGQAYVALSRVRSLDNLRILDFDPSVIKANDVVDQFYKTMSFKSSKTSGRDKSSSNSNINAKSGNKLNFD